MKLLLSLSTFIAFLLSFPVLSANESNKASVNVEPLTDNVYLHTSYHYVPPWGNVAASGLVFIDGNDAYIIDTPWNNQDTKALVDWITQKGYNLKAAIVTHFHSDAAGGLGYLNDMGITTYANKLTNELLQQHDKETATNDFEQQNETLLPNKLETFYPGAGHAPDNIVVWLAQHNILFGGCFIRHGNSKSLGNLGDADITAWPQSISKVIKRYPNVSQVIPGHGPIGDSKLLSHTRELALKAIKEAQN